MKFIPDEEINLSKDDLLGTRTYVETLVDIVKTCDTPFTIGLLGGWGSGKSSIVKTLKEEKFDKDANSKIKVFIYDAWKYSKDSFRRSFIIKLLKDFELKLDEKLIKEKFYLSETKTTEWGISKILSYKRSGSKTFSPIIYPELFEKIFQEITAKITGKPSKKFEYIKGKYRRKCEKLAICIDNIDRCYKEVALETLLTVKNFLSIPNVVFIIPVDEDGIKKYLKLTAQDANEFLRKLFNTTIKIKKFSPYDLFDFCKKLKKRYNLNFSDEVLSIVAQEFAKNPRRIIQFLNNLQSEILLAKKIEEAGLVGPKGVITNNVPMLAKLLIIKEEWPDLYKKIGDDANLLKRINQSFRERQFGPKDDTYKLEEENITLTTEQYRFLVRTSSVPTDKLEPFLVNRDVFKDIPDEINELVLSQDWDAIKEKYLNKKAISLNRLVNFIAQKLDQDVIKRSLFSTSGFNLLTLIFKIVNDNKYGPELRNLYTKPFFGKVITVCDMKWVKGFIFEFNSEGLIKFAKWLYGKGERGLLNNIVRVVKRIPESKKKEKQQINIVKVFINAFQKQPKRLEKIKDAFSQFLIKDPQLVNEFKEVLKDRSVSDSLVTANLTKNFLDSLKGDLNQDNTREKVELLNTLCENGYLSEKKLNALYIEKIVQFANANNWEFMLFWFDTLKVPFEKIGRNISEELAKEIYELLNNRYQWLYNQYTAGQTSEIPIRVYKSFLDLCFLLYSNPNTYDGNIIQWVNSFFGRNESAEIYSYINKLYLKIIDKFKVYNWPFSQQIINRFVNAAWPQKKEFALSLNKMLLKKTDEAGLTEQQISTILDQYLNIAKTQQDEQSADAEKWIKEVIKNKVIKEQLRVKISNINNPQELLTLLDIVLKLKNKILVQEVMIKILLQTSCEDIENVVGNLFNNKKISIKIFQQGIEKRINDLDIEKNAQDRDCLFQLIGLKKIINKKISEKIIDKLKPLLATNNKEDQLFALKCLDNIENLPASKKNLLKTLLREIKTDGWQDEEKKLLGKIKKRK